MINNLTLTGHSRYLILQQFTIVNRTCDKFDADLSNLKVGLVTLFCLSFFCQTSVQKRYYQTIFLRWIVQDFGDI